VRSPLLALGAAAAIGCHSGEPFELRDFAAPCGPEACAPREVAELALGWGYTCARFAAGAVKCWGRNESGVLGYGPLHPAVFEPSQVGVLEFGSARSVVQISAGWHHACAVFEDHRARCWGRNDAGQLGIGSTEDYGDDLGETLAALPDLPLENVTQISAGLRNTCAIVSAAPERPGRVHCWGSDLGGALGDRASGAFGDDEPVDGTRPVALPDDAVRVATGAELACALLANGAVHCWGDNWAKTLGIGDSTCDIGDERPCFGDQGRVPDIPVVGLSRRSIVDVFVNQTSACVIENAGALLCWGRNSQSRLGYPDALEGEFLGAPPGPVALGSSLAVVDLGRGVRHACALDAQGSIRCFGERGPALGYAMDPEEGVAGIGGIQTPAAAYALRSDQGIVDVGDFDGVEGVDPARAIYAGASATCALLVSGDVRCWGTNEFGELGYGDPLQVGAIGDDATPGSEYRRLGRRSVRFFEE